MTKRNKISLLWVNKFKEYLETLPREQVIDEFLRYCNEQEKEVIKRWNTPNKWKGFDEYIDEVMKDE